MVWIEAGLPNVVALISYGHLPDIHAKIHRRRKDLRLLRDEIPKTSDNESISDANDAVGAWMLSSLARQRLGLHHNLEEQKAKFAMQTWVFNRGIRKNGALDRWFEYSDEDGSGVFDWEHKARYAGFGGGFRVFLHVYPRVQDGHTLPDNIFSYPYYRLGINPCIRKTSQAAKVSIPIVKAVGYLHQEAPQHLEDYIKSLNHPYATSQGWPTQ